MSAAHQNILVIKLGALGDFIQALGAMAAIRKHHKGSKITLLTTQPYREFGESCGYFDHIWLDKKPRWCDIKGWLDLRKKLSAENFTRVYDLQNSDRTSFYLRLFKNNPEWVGAAKGATHRNNSPRRTAGHAFDGHVQTLLLAGIEDVQIDELDWMKADISKFGLKNPYILFVPGSAPNHPQKRWPTEHYAQLAGEIAARGYQPVLLGTEDEKDITKIISQSCVQALDLTGQTSLFQIAVLARGAQAAIGNDTGPIHLIAATGCACIALFSKYSNATKHAPQGGGVKILQKENLTDINVKDIFKALKLEKTAA